MVVVAMVMGQMVVQQVVVVVVASGTLPDTSPRAATGCRMDRSRPVALHMWHRSMHLGCCCRSDHCQAMCKAGWAEAEMEQAVVARVAVETVKVGASVVEMKEAAQVLEGLDTAVEVMEAV